MGHCSPLQATSWPYGPGRLESDTCIEDSEYDLDWRAVAYERAAVRQCRFIMSTQKMVELFVKDRQALDVDCVGMHPAMVLAFGARCSC